MKKKQEQLWIDAGYCLFAEAGPKGLKVELIARKVGKSKSSFYHLFADIDIFQDKLIQYHCLRSKEVAVRAGLCKTVVPDLFNLLVEIKQDIFFNRQLRVHRNNPVFQKCVEITTEEVGGAVIVIWANSFGLSEKLHVAKGIMRLTMDSFFLRISEENFSYETLTSLLGELKEVVNNIANNGKL